MRIELKSTQMPTKPISAATRHSFIVESAAYIVKRMWQMSLIRRFKWTNKHHDHDDAIIINFHFKCVINFHGDRTGDDNADVGVVVVDDCFFPSFGEISFGGDDVCATRTAAKNALGIAAIKKSVCINNVDNGAFRNTIFEPAYFSYEKCARTFSKSILFLLASNTFWWNCVGLMPFIICNSTVAIIVCHINSVSDANNFANSMHFCRRPNRFLFNLTSDKSLESVACMVEKQTFIPDYMCAEFQNSSVSRI